MRIDMRPKGNEEGPLSHLLAPELDTEVKRVLAERQFSSMEELNRVVGSVVERYNRKPQGDLGGLSPVQVTRLIHSD